MGGAALPTASTPGYRKFQHASGTFVACDCLVDWLLTLERLCLAHGYIKYNLDILQLTGGNPLSGDTHTAGGVFDIKQYDKRIALLCREMGAPATWLRNMNFADGSPGNTHTHGVLLGCIHNWPARYQLDAQRAGKNGFGYMGLKGPDDLTGPATYRTWKQGIAWAEAEIKRLSTSTPTLTPQETFLMSLTDNEQKRVLNAADRTMGRDPQRYMVYDEATKNWRSVPEGTKGAKPAPSLDSLDGQTLRNDIASLRASQAANNAALLAALTALGSGQKIDVNAITEAARKGAELALADGVKLTVSVGGE